LVSEGKSCRDSYEFKSKTSLEGCASACRASSTMFAHAFKGNTRCSSGLCDCYCITGAKEDGTCTYYSNQYYKLYKYSDPKAAYTIVKSNAECSSASTYGLSRKTSVKTLAECAQTARNAGVNLFVSCQNSKFYCYIYTKTQSSTTCTTKHNGFKCNVYKVTGAASPTVGCVTTDKKKCVFPFKYKGVTYNGCSTANNGGKLWCSTENKADLNYNKWGNCDVNACKGTWASWGSWGSCSAECGNGEQKRTRKCEGRSACSGDDKESKTCKVKDCVKEVQTFGLCKSETSMIIATCVEITDLKVKCLFKGRSKTAPVTCPISSSKTHFVCKGVKGEEEVDCCDYSCS